jgi:hypothetical protein
MEEKYAKAKDVVFFHVQTVFEGFKTNTPERGPKEAKGKGIEVPVGYDARADGERVSGIMSQYGTGGTPWTIVIDKKGQVRHSAVTPDAKTLSKLIDKLRKGR